MITPWLDSTWGNTISYDDSFNTVYYGTPESDDKFELISFIDQFAPLCGTTNDKVYFFTYNTKNDHNGYLLFSCYVGQGNEGEVFVQNLADWSGAIVYASSNKTGPLYERTLKSFNFKVL